MSNLKINEAENLYEIRFHKRLVLIHILYSGDRQVPKRGCADIVSVTIRVVAVLYLFIQGVVFVFGITRGQIEVGGMASALFFACVGFGFGTLLEIAISIERRLYEHN